MIATSDYRLFTRITNGQYIKTSVNERKRNKRYLMMKNLGVLNNV